MTDKEKLDAYRKKKFDVRVVLSGKKRSYSCDDLSVEITHNGYQWWCVGLTIDEAKQVVFAINHAIRLHEQKEDS
jgi:hypothetical protein